MPDNTALNYPDILGYLTGGQRCNLNVVQAAMAVRPRVVRAGRAFETILVVQNASDVEVDVAATLQVPEQDAKKQKGRFIAKNARLVVGLRPAEAGYVVLPMSCLPNTAISEGYKVGIDVDVKPLKKPGRVRLPEGGGDVDLSHLSDDTIRRLRDLQSLTFSTSKRMGRSVLEAQFSVISGQLGQMVDFKPEWVSLWTLADHMDEKLLLERFGPLMAERVLPRIKRDSVFEPLFEATEQRFQQAGYPLDVAETLYITKLLVRILEMAQPADDSFDYLAADIYNVSLLLKKGAPAGRGASAARSLPTPKPDDDAPPVLPYWFSGFLHHVARDEHVASQPAQLLAQELYGDLLRDAATHAFQMLRTATGEDVGTEQEIADYGQRLAELLKTSGQLNFTYAYMPLVMGGIIVYDKVIAPDEHVVDMLLEMRKSPEKRAPERDGSSEQVFKLAGVILERALQKYGYS